MRPTPCRDEIRQLKVAYHNGRLNKQDAASMEAFLQEEAEDGEAGLQRLEEVEDFMLGVVGPETRRHQAQGVAPRDHEDTEDDVLVPAPARSFLENLSRQFGVAPWWMISGAFHALLLLLVTLITMALTLNKDEEVVIVTDLEQKREPEEIKEPEKREIFEKPVPIETEEIQTEENPIVTHEEVEIADHVETADDSDAEDTRGEDGISDVFLGGSGSVAALGLGGGGGGAFGRPGGAGGRLRRALQGGGGKATESAVDAALAWLARHQEADGHWDAKKYGGGKQYRPVYYDHSVTSLAMLAFLGAGHTDRLGKYRDTVKRGLAWIQANHTSMHQKNDVRAIYDCALNTLALSEAFGMTGDAALGREAQKGVDYMLSVQESHGGWNHGKFKSTSVLGWVVMALKSAKVAGLNVAAKGFEGAMRRLEDVSVKDADGYWGMVGYTGRKDYKYHSGILTTSIGMVCLQFMGRGGETGNQAEIVCKHLPKWQPEAGKQGSPQNFYFWYYGTLGVFQTGGGLWKAWNESLKSTLLPSQRKGGPRDGSPQDTDGSWDPVTTWDDHGGRVYTTAMGALCLEVYYRYLPLYK